MIFIVGPGAMGFAFAATLSAAGETVTVVSRTAGTPLVLPRVLHEGRALAFGRQVHGCHWDDLPPLTGTDLVFLTIKAYDLENCLKSLMPHMQGACPIVVCSNGLNVYFEAASFIQRRAPLLRLLAYFGARPGADGTLLLTGKLHCTVAAPTDSTSSEPLRRLETLLGSAGFNVATAVNIARAEWEKAFVNIVVNSLASLADLPNGALLTQEPLRELTLQLFAEAQNVARAEGFSFPELTPNVLLEKIGATRHNLNSTLLDLRSGRRTETPYLLGRLVKLADLYGVQTPVAATVERLLRGKEQGQLASVMKLSD